MEERAVTEFWAGLGGAPEAVSRLRITGPPGTLPSPLPVTDLAVAAVASAGLAAAELVTARGGPVLGCDVHRSAVATAFTSERHLRLAGAAVGGWAPLSGFFPTRDGWVRTHANYPHHEERLLRALGLPPGTETFAAHVANMDALDVESVVTAAGGLAVAVRSPSAWASSEARVAAATGPLVSLTGAPAARASKPAERSPAAGIRVLDLTRVIAGPVATRTLAYLGADVLRVDAPGLPEIEAQHLDTGLGKRSTLLDLRSAADRRTFDELLAGADVLVTGYRAGALDAFGLGADQLRAGRPDLVVASLTAWGATGPWRERRGFDSLVQAATGIAELTGTDAPGVLPAQALDHATGYLLAAAILRALADPTVGATITASLARTASWLLTAPRPAHPATTGAAPPAADDWLADLPSPYGVVRHAVPPFRLDGAPGTWPTGPVRYGTSQPRWVP